MEIKDWREGCSPDEITLGEMDLWFYNEDTGSGSEFYVHPLSENEHEYLKSEWKRKDRMIEWLSKELKLRLNVTEEQVNYYRPRVDWSKRNDRSTVDESSTKSTC